MNSASVLFLGGRRVEARAPVIVSASRRTDIPAFHADWFFHTLDDGYAVCRNPFNGIPYYVSYERTRVVVFWSKNPSPLLTYMPELERRGINCCVQYTLNGYDRRIEPFVPCYETGVDTFRRLVDAIGFGRVVWRFDPVLSAGERDVDTLLTHVERIGDMLQGYTERLVFSFADIERYAGVRRRIAASGVPVRELTVMEQERFAAGLSELNRRWNYALSTCAERITLDRYGITHGRCIDGGLMRRYFAGDAVLMEYLDSCGGAMGKDRGQRPECGCIPSVDIGEYGTCHHGCLYCYANRG